MNITSKPEVVSPTKAKTWLQKNLFNRKPSQIVIDRYAANMKAGKFPLTGMPIIFDQEGNVLNGQHQLLAIIKANVPVEIMVTRGIEKKNFKYMDIGKNRSAADVLKIDGIENPMAMASTISFILLHESGKYSDAANYGRRKAYFTNADISTFAKKYLNDLEASIKIGYAKDNKKVVPSGYLAAFHFLFSRLSKKDADDFCEKVVFGEGLNRKHPIFHLREVFRVDALASKNKMTKYYKLGLFHKAWNAYRKKQELTFLKFDMNKEKLPPLL